MARRLIELPEVEIRESIFELDSMLKKLSGIDVNKKHISNDVTEAVLCIGNEIKKIKAFLELE